MIGHEARFRENDDLPFWRGPAAKKKPPFFNARALITRKIMRSRNAQCKILGNNLKITTTATATATATSLNNRFNEENNDCARAL